MEVNRVNSSRVTSVVLIHTQVLLATSGILRDPFPKTLVDCHFFIGKVIYIWAFPKLEFFSHLSGSHRVSRVGASVFHC